ncbi:MAG: hypothetical protein EOO01_17990, partial [Chitinophagaceae bacterium]
IMSDAYLFIGINNFEMNQLPAAESALYAAKRVFPAQPGNPKRIRYLVREEHVFNNIAQLKLAQRQYDSAFWYVSKAYNYAVSVSSTRGIPNTLQTKGRIFMARNQRDSARFYLQRSNDAAIRYNFPDILLINHGYLMEFSRDREELARLYNTGLRIIGRKKINLTFQKMFFSIALSAFKGIGESQTVMELQDRIIAIDKETSYTGNLHIQQISNQYVRNENKIMALQVRELNRQRNIVLLQLFAALMCVLLLVMVILAFRRKNRLQRALLEQKNDISQDLHDDIGSGLSSILIHADLLRKATDSSARDKATAARIESTALEISLRLHTFIWSLNNQNDTIQDFCEYVKQYAFRLFESVPMQLNYVQEVTDLHYALNGKIRKNLFYCVKEILNNALKHSKADALTIEMHQDRKHFSITVTDNGVGLQQQNAFGNGLNNIKRRIDNIGGEIAIETSGGLIVRLSLPVR